MFPSCFGESNFPTADTITPENDIDTTCPDLSQYYFTHKSSAITATDSNANLYPSLVSTPPPPISQYHDDYTTDWNNIGVATAASIPSVPLPPPFPMDNIGGPTPFYFQNSSIKPTLAGAPTNFMNLNKDNSFGNDSSDIYGFNGAMDTSSAASSASSNGGFYGCYPPNFGSGVALPPMSAAPATFPPFPQLPPPPFFPIGTPVNATTTAITAPDTVGTAEHLWENVYFPTPPPTIPPGMYEGSCDFPSIMPLLDYSELETSSSSRVTLDQAGENTDPNVRSTLGDTTSATSTSHSSTTTSTSTSPSRSTSTSTSQASDSPIRVPPNFITLDTLMKTLPLATIEPLPTLPSTTNLAPTTLPPQLEPSPQENYDNNAAPMVKPMVKQEVIKRKSKKRSKKKSKKKKSSRKKSVGNGGDISEESSDAGTDVVSDGEVKSMKPMVRKCAYSKKYGDMLEASVSYKPKPNDNRPWVCPQSMCLSRFKTQIALHSHYRKHTEFAFVCRYCNKPFARRCNLKDHERIHTGEKPYQCRMCGKGFKQKHCLADHERIHTGEKPFECSVCHRRFAVKNNLKSHFKLHKK